MTLLLILLFIAGLSANFSFFLDFALGNPSGQPQTGAILFNWTLFLAKRRLKKEDAEFLRINESFKAELVAGARRYFTFENMLGMCSICTNFWVATIFYLVSLGLYSYPISGFYLFVSWLTVTLLSHAILRKFFYNQ